MLLRRVNSLSISSACCCAAALRVSEGTKKAFARTRPSIPSSICTVWSESVKIRVAVTSTRVGFLYRRKFTSSTMMKNAIVSTTMLLPYRPCRPTRNIAIALGESTSARNTSTIPITITVTENSCNSSTVKYIAPPASSATTPTTAATKLQKPVDCSEDSTRSFRLSPPPWSPSGILSTIYRHLRVSNDLTAMNRNTAAMLR